MGLVNTLRMDCHLVRKLHLVITPKAMVVELRYDVQQERPPLHLARNLVMIAEVSFIL